MIPLERAADAEALSKFIAKHLDIYLSTVDTYRLWDKISDEFCAGWLDIDFTIDGMRREDFLLYYIEQYCVKCRVGSEI